MYGAHDLCAHFESEWITVETSDTDISVMSEHLPAFFTFACGCRVAVTSFNE